jgi:multisubunit Na+/H+ antiporter MnhE subunit
MRLASTYVAWWIALFWLWLVYQGEWNRIQWVAAACAATLGATLATVLAARGLLRFRVPLRAVLDAKNVPLQIVIDFGIVSLALARRLLGTKTRGAFVVRSSASGGDDPRAVGDRACRAVLATLSPNAYVVDMNAESHEVLVHDLVVHRPSESPA